MSEHRNKHFPVSFYSGKVAVLLKREILRHTSDTFFLCSLSVKELPRSLLHCVCSCLFFLYGIGFHFVPALVSSVSTHALCEKNGPERLVAMSRWKDSLQLPRAELDVGSVSHQVLHLQCTSWSRS